MREGKISRGETLLKGGQRFARPPGFFARLLAPGIDHIVDRIDAGLSKGTLLAELPDGSIRQLGGRNEGFEARIKVSDWRAVLRLATNGSIGWYQAWEAGEWESPDLASLFAIFADNSTTLGSIGRSKGPFRLAARIAHRFNRNSKSGAQRNIHAHYDLGNDFYAQWLDPSMTYSCARFDGTEDLETAQHVKWHALAKRIGNPESILEIGCGWGSLANYLSGRRAQVTAISLSDEQLKWARQRQDQSITFLNQDYRDTNGQFDAIVSVEMVEALGHEYWPTFMDCIARNLKPGGKAAIQYISMQDDLFEAYAAGADFIQAYIFPGGLLIRSSEFKRLAEERGLHWQDQVDFAHDYAKTLRIWRERFDLAVAEKRLPEGFDQRFIDLWRFYLQYCEGGFMAGTIDVHQVTLTK